MDCLICFKIFIKETEYENISLPNGDICARSICNLLEITNSQRIQEIFNDPGICSKCYQTLENANKFFVQLEDLQIKIEEIRARIAKDLKNSKNVSQVMQDAYRGEMSKSSKDRLEIFKVMRLSDGISANISPLQIDPLQQEISIQSTTLPLSPKISNQTNGNQWKPAKISSGMEISKNPNNSVSRMEKISHAPQIEIKLERKEFPEKCERTRKSKYSMHLYCTICKDRFFSKSSLLRHMNQHSSMKGRQPDKNINDFICAECGKPHKSETDLQTHMECVLNSKNIQKCSLCPEEFWGGQCLEFHQENSHSNEKPYKIDSKDKIELDKKFECHECGMQFARNGSLFNHRLIHELKKFKCSFAGCGKKFHRKDNMKIHLAKHSKPKLIKRMKHLRNPKIYKAQKKFQCQFCFKKFWSKMDIQIHLGDEKSEYCGICKEDFKSKGCLKHHNSISHGMSYYSSSKATERQDLVECKICHKYYSSRRFRRHELTHTGPKFKCHEIGCDKSFKRKDTMIEHIKIIHKGIKYECKFDGCKKMFNQKNSLNLHVKKMHKKD